MTGEFKAVRRREDRKPDRKQEKKPERKSARERAEGSRRPAVQRLSALRPGGQDGRRVSLRRGDSDRIGVMAEKVARFSGTPRFLIYMTVFVVVWFIWNTLAPSSLRFDPYTFTFLTLVLSLQASYSAPFILLAQNRQDDRDRVQLEEDRRRAAAAKADTEFIARELAALRIAMGEVATRDFVRGELARALEEMRTDAAEAADVPGPADASSAPVEPTPSNSGPTARDGGQNAPDGSTAEPGERGGEGAPAHRGPATARPPAGSVSSHHRNSPAGHGRGDA